MKAETEGFTFIFINMYAPNHGPERLSVFKLLKDSLDSCGQGECFIIGGDWNCCTDVTLDRTGQELHPQSSSFLFQLLKETS